MPPNKATYWVQATAGVNYYRAELPARYLPGQCCLLNATQDTSTSPDIFGNERFPRQQGAAIWLFSGNTTRALIMAEMRNQGVPVFLEVDDNYTMHPPTAHLTGGTSWVKQRDMKDDKHSYEVHVDIARRVAQGVICSVPRLAEVYSRFNPNVHVCRNAIDPTDWADPPASDGVLRIGWAGSWSHIYDVADIRKALDWASHQPNVEVVLMGLDPGWKFKYTHVPWTDSVADYRAAVGLIDVMLCPIRPSEWADCKSDVKALEASMGGACSLVSKTEPYRPWWDGEAPGYFASTPKEYLRMVKHLVANPDEARQTARLAREYVLEQRNIQVTVREWAEALSSVPDRTFKVEAPPERRMITV